MPVTYSMQNVGRYPLGMALTYQLLHDRFGFDLGQRYHRDVEHRIKTTMEIDRVVFETYGRIGLGYESPYPRVSVEPYGHRFMPALYGCEIGYAQNAEPSGRPRVLAAEEIEALEPWTVARFETCEPVRAVLDQVRQLKSCYGKYRVPDQQFNPHCRTMSSLQNLGSVINTAFSLQGEQLLADYITRPDLVRKLYENITQLTLLCLDYFPQVDGWPLKDIFIGNCSVSMISPDHYAALNYPCDRRLMEYARSVGARFMMHQDSGATVHLQNYAQFDYLHALDVGQDTDFEELGRRFPQADVNCILFPSWIETKAMDDIRAELRRLMEVGRRFPSFSFTLLEIDTKLGDDLIFSFYETFRQCAMDAGSS
ncbi:MAG: uroporphyrinogen decarboxylase family protein [Pirellulaceae bacterium]